MRKWTRINKEKINHIDLINEFTSLNSKAVIRIGTDSKFYTRNNGGFSVTYITIIALDPGTHSGQNLIVSKEYIKGAGKSERITIYDRLWKEVEITREVALEVREKCNINPEVHIDINPNKNTKSSHLYASAMGFMEAEGFKVKGKPDGPVATSAADHYLNNGFQ